MGCSPQAEFAARDTPQGAETSCNETTDTGATALDNAEVVSWNPPTSLECGESAQADHLDYVSKIVCDNEGDVIEIDLSDYAGGYLWFGSHAPPDGGGNMTNTCLARWE